MDGWPHLLFCRCPSVRAGAGAGGKKGALGPHSRSGKSGRSRSLSLSVSRSLSLSVSDENSFFPNVFLLQQEKATLFPIVETKKRLLSGLVRGPIVVTNCQNGPKSCPLSRDAPLPLLARPDKLLQMGGNSVSIELCDCFEKCPHQGRLMTRYISS